MLASNIELIRVDNRGCRTLRLTQVGKSKHTSCRWNSKRLLNTTRISSSSNGLCGSCVSSLRLTHYKVPTSWCCEARKQTIKARVVEKGRPILPNHSLESRCPVRTTSIAGFYENDRADMSTHDTDGLQENHRHRLKEVRRVNVSHASQFGPSTARSPVSTQLTFGDHQLLQVSKPYCCAEHSGGNCHAFLGRHSGSPSTWTTTRRCNTSRVPAWELFAQHTVL